MPDTAASLANPPPISFARGYGLPVLLFLAVVGIGYLDDLETTHALILGLLCALTLAGFLQAQSYRRYFAAQAALLVANENTFRHALDNASHGLALISSDGKWLQANQAAAAITGYSVEELLTLDFQTITHPDDLDADMHFVQQVLARKIETYAMEKRYIRKDGSIVWVLLTVSAAWDASGQFRYFISEIRDINERKLLQEKLRASEARLRNA